MTRVLKNIEPEKVFQYFEDISQIPRGSKNEKQISDYLVKFARDRGLEYIQDEYLNVIIKKEGTNGYENASTVVLQGHMDMVWEKNEDVEHDFINEPLKLKIEDDFISASGTTLGADNGIAVAYALGILDSDDIPHPPLEVLITTDEESGMTGAIGLDSNNIKGKILLNIDSGEEGKLLTSCAGGMRSLIKIPIKKESLNTDSTGYIIKVRGLKGGHSGVDIDKGRGNSNKIMGRILSEISFDTDIRLISITGGAKANAIPREADSIVSVNKVDIQKIEDIIENLKEKIKNELKSSDSDIIIQLEKTNAKYSESYSSETTQKIIETLVLIPNGVQTMSSDIKGLVQSSNNVGVITTTDNEVLIENAIRSSVDSLKIDISNKIKVLAKALKIEYINDSSYPSWSYREDSYIRNVFIESFKEVYGKEPDVTAIHAGLECGQFSEKFNNELDMISFGPDMFDIHTPDEKLSISSTKRTWQLLLNILKSIK